MKRTKISNFKHNIIIQKEETTFDELGQPLFNWSDFISRRASVDIKSGGEYWASRKENAEWDGLFKVFYDSETCLIDTKMRIKYTKNNKDHYFNITNAFDKEEANIEIHMEAKEVV